MLIHKNILAVFKRKDNSCYRIKQVFTIGGAHKVMVTVAHTTKLEMIIILRFDVKPYVGNSISQIYVWDDITAQSHESAIIKHHNPGTRLVNILIFWEASRKVSGKYLQKSVILMMLLCIGTNRNSHHDVY